MSSGENDYDGGDIFTNYYGGYEGGAGHIYTHPMHDRLISAVPITRKHLVQTFAAVQFSGFILLVLIVITYLFVSLGINNPGFDVSAAFKSLLVLLPTSVGLLFGGELLRNLAGGHGFRSDIVRELWTVKEDIFMNDRYQSF